MFGAWPKYEDWATDINYSVLLLIVPRPGGSKRPFVTVRKVNKWHEANFKIDFIQYLLKKNFDNNVIVITVIA